MQLFKLTLLGFVASLATARVAPTQTTRKISGVYTAEGLYSAPALETLKDNMDFIPTTKEDGFIDVFCDKKLAGPMPSREMYKCIHSCRDMFGFQFGCYNSRCGVPKDETEGKCWCDCSYSPHAAHAEH